MISNVWVALATPSSPAGAVPFIDPSALTPNVDANNLYYDNTNKRLNIAHGGDTGGVDSLNLYKQADSYLPQSQIVLATNVMPGFTVSSSRGTGVVPAISQAGDTIGKFSGYVYAGTVPAYVEMAGIYMMMSPSGTATDLGGELHLYTKTNAGISTDRLTLDNAGQLFPTTNAGARLGKAAFGYGALTLDYTNTATVGAVTINKPAGRVNIALGAASVVVTNSLVTVNSIVIAQLAFVDATLTFVKCVVSAAGSFTITGNSNATANTAVNFFVVNTDS